MYVNKQTKKKNANNAKLVTHLPHKVAKQFETICAVHGEKPSAVLRRLIVGYCD